MNAGWLLVMGIRLAATAPVDEARGLVDNRTRIVTEQRDEARTRARGEVFLSYRFLRLKEASLFAEPDFRREQTAALGTALALARRSLGETEAYDTELQHLATERELLQVRGRQHSENVIGIEASRALFGRGLSWPARGTLLAGPGTRADLATGVMARADGISVLGRFGATVSSPAAARVRRIQPEAAGGFSVVLEHKDGFVSVLGGMRDVTAALGADVLQNEPVGILGRSLDGAPVLGFELWRNGTAVDPTRFTRKRKP